MGKVSWLHVSDIHIVRPTSTPGAEAFNQEQALNRFVDFLKNSFPHDQMTMPTYLLIAGDLAFRGQKDDYQNSRKFSVMKMVDAVAGAMAIRPKDYSDRVFPVPGNHDIDRTGLKDPDLERANLATGADEDKLNDLFLNKDKEKRRAGILARSRAYCDFVRNLWGDGSLMDEEVLWYARSIPIPGLTEPLYLVGMNSAWLCHSYWATHMAGTELEKEPEPTSHLTLCEAVVEKLFDCIPRDALTIGLMHHDYDITRDRNSAVQHLLESRCDFILCGHEHSEQWVLPTSGRALKIRSGRFYEQRGWRGAVNVVEVDTDTMQAKMLTIHYRPDKGGFWAVERDYDPTGGQAGYFFDPAAGILRFDLDRAGMRVKPSVPPSPPAAKVNKVRKRVKRPVPAARVLANARGVRGPVRPPAGAAPVPADVDGGWQEYLLGAKPRIIKTIGRAYVDTEGYFWGLLDEAKFENRSRVAGSSFFLRTASLVSLLAFHAEYPVVRRFFELLTVDCPEVGIFQEVLEELKRRGEGK